jgi:serine/threonine protein phosphatase PrpC
MLAAAGRTDPGTEREVNEDRFHVDVARGIFAVIDGVGGQAAGGRAADVAVSLVRERLERETGPVADRIREAIAVANNEIHRLASTRAEWEGMACVLTIAVVNDGTATIGHVGDTRLYQIGVASIEKITRDHSPVGEREDAGELTELQAMRHPRRNEVYRDVGSERHAPGDADFIDVDEIAFGPDTALLLCTDGLSDLVDSSSIARIVAERAGDPDAVVSALIEAANAAGGKDNVTVVYVEGERFAQSWRPFARRPVATEDPLRDRMNAAREGAHVQDAGPEPARTRRPFVTFAVVALLALVTAGAFWRAGYRLPWPALPWLETPPQSEAAPVAADVLIVQPGGSIADAIRNAEPDSEILVEPGEYREPLMLKDRVRLVSRVPRGAVLRLPAAVPDGATLPAILATGLSRGELVGFRIVGDAATPLAVGVRVETSAVSLVDVEVTGATRAAIEFSGPGSAVLLGSDIHDNPGVALWLHDGAAPRIAHNVFARNGTSERSAGPLNLTGNAGVRFTGNVFHGLSLAAFAGLDNPTRLAIQNENWFVPVSPRRTTRGTGPNAPQRNR